MKSYLVTLAGTSFKLNADAFNQIGEYVAFYINKQCVGMVRLAQCDSIFEEAVMRPPHRRAPYPSSAGAPTANADAPTV